MSRYKFTLSGSSIRILKENDSPLIIETVESVSINFLDDRESNDSIVDFDPTFEFWEELVALNERVSKINEYYSHRQAYFSSDLHVPDISEFEVGYNKRLPAYEACIAYSAGGNILRLNQETNTVFGEYPSYRRLFRHAYSEATGEVPEYLREFRY